MPDNENYIARITSIAKDSWVSEAGCDTQKSRKSKVPLFGMLIGMSTFRPCAGRGVARRKSGSYFFEK